MNSTFSLLPEQASTLAPEIDLLYLFLVGVSVLFALLAAGLVLGFAIKYRRKSEDEIPAAPHEDSRLEIVCSIFLLVLVMIMFGWGAKLFFKAYRPPADAIEILVTGKQWMWKVQHPQGRREINALHVPIHTPVRLTMSSEDVIHSFYVPAFRVKQDVVPGKFTSLWFEATKLGNYHLFCAEYCGTDHSAMRGTVTVMSKSAYEAWLQGQATGPVDVTMTPAELGKEVFTQFGCAVCHTFAPGALGPDLRGIFGTTVTLSDDTQVEVDENYLRESILSSQAKLVKGFQPVMPLFKGLVSEEQLVYLITYIKSLSDTAKAGN